MEKQAVYFIEVDGEKHYKCDTFWSKSTNLKNAKIHNDSDYDKNRFFESLCYSIKPNSDNEKYFDLTDERYNHVKKFEGGIYGYQVVGKEIDQDYYYGRSSSEIKASEPVYLKIIEKIPQVGRLEVIDYKVIDRERKIKEITNEIDN